MGNEASAAVALASAKKQTTDFFNEATGSLNNVPKKEQPVNNREMEKRHKERVEEFEKRKKERAAKKQSLQEKWSSSRKQNAPSEQKSIWSSAFGGDSSNAQRPERPTRAFASSEPATTTPSPAPAKPAASSGGEKKSSGGGNAEWWKE